jgi:hypothetical protein
VERLAFGNGCLEADLPEIWMEPLPAVIRVLTEYVTVEEVYEHLPDVNTAKPNSSPSPTFSPG